MSRFWQRVRGPFDTRIAAGYRGINIVHDGPAVSVPEPGGLPAAEPLDYTPICVARGERSGGLWVIPNTPKIVPAPVPGGARPPGAYR